MGPIPRVLCCAQVVYNCCAQVVYNCCAPIIHSKMWVEHNTINLILLQSVLFLALEGRAKPI